jgi:3-oxoacyl-[acyl-carrier-protein] synthase-3
MRWDDIYLSGTGRFLPARTATADLPADRYDHGALRLADYVSYAASPTLTAPEMAAAAAREALARSRHSAADLGVIVYAQFDETDHLAPACHLQRVLDVPRALAFELGAASAGAATGLVVAAGLLQADPSVRAALITAAGRHLPPRWPSRQVFGLVLGDGAAAAVLTRGHGPARLLAAAHGGVPDLETMCVTDGADAQELPIVRIGLGPFLGDIRDSVVRVVDDVLAEAGVKLSEVTRFAVTGVGLAQLNAMVLEPLGITAGQTTWELLRRTGHVGACDPLLGLDQLLRDGDLRPGDTVLVLGTGLGFRHTALLLEITHPAAPGGPAAPLEQR